MTDDEWAFAAPYLTLMREDAPQRRYPLRELFDAAPALALGGGALLRLDGPFPAAGA